MNITKKNKYTIVNIGNDFFKVTQPKMMPKANFRAVLIKIN